MYSMIFDTETCSLQKPFCYDVGYVIMDNDSGEIILGKHFIVEQIWHNNELFSTAYYAEKREKYVTLMRTRKAIMSKFGYITQEMIRDIKKYEITDAYAYNSDFDDKVFQFNCEWFKCINPFDNIAIHDIWGYVSEFITPKDDYKKYCETYNRFTDGGNYSASAETIYQFITNNAEFTEEHMGLYDAIIEAKILYECISKYNAEWNYDYKVVKILNRQIAKPYKIIINNETIYEGEYIKKWNRNDVYKFTEG